MSKIVNDVIKVGATNVLILLIGIVSGFVLPKYLTILDYSYYRTYFLYISLLGFFHFGFLDGLYLKYGGIELKDIKKGTLADEFYFLVIQQIIITTILVILFIVLGLDTIYLLVLLTLIPTNIFTFFSFLYQATGRFTEFSFLNVLKNVMNFIPIIILFFIMVIKDVDVLIISQIALSFLVIVIIYLYNFGYLKNVRTNRIFDRDKLTLMKVGIFIMIGNFSNILFFSLDRWFIKIFYDDVDFAIYSFAITLLTIVMLMITSVSMTFYPYFAKNISNHIWIKRVKKIVLILGVIGIGFFYPIKVIIEWYIPEYNASMAVVGLLFIGLPLSGIINSVYINIYKVLKKEKMYFITVMLMLVVSVITLFIAYFISSTLESIAIATSLTFIIWYIYSSRYKGYLNISLREYLFIAGYTITFLMTYLLENPLVGVIVYFGIISLLIHAYDRKFYTETISIIKEKLTV